MRNAKIIVVDDNEAVLRSLRTILSHEFKTIVTVSSPVLLPALLRNGDVDMVLLDMNFGAGKQSGGEGLFWLDRILELKNPPAVILITAFGDIELAVSSKGSLGLYRETFGITRNLFKPLSMCGNTVWNQIQIRFHLWPNLLLMHC